MAGTPEQVYFSVQSWLKRFRRKIWTNGFLYIPYRHYKTYIALILAGNIPLVGFHDFLSVLISGHSVLIKTSSNDQHLLPL
jgi:hypothetical protein